MAPRSAKNKKAADVKVTENEAPKKGRGKAKQIEEVETESAEVVDVKEKVVAAPENKKRGKKAANNKEQVNGVDEPAPPPAKKSRKKAEPVPEHKTNDDNSTEEETITPSEEIEQSEETDTNGHTEEAQSAPVTKGRKKPTKKETEKGDAKPARGKKGKQTEESAESGEVKDEKPKARGRARKGAAKSEAEVENKTDLEEVKADPPAKGRKKAAPKEVQKKDDVDEEELPEVELEGAPEPEKKETKPRGRGKKATPKDDPEEDSEEAPASKKRKVTKKEEKGKGEPKEEVVETKKGKRGRKVDTPVEEEESLESSDTGNKRRRKVEEKAPAEDKKKKAPPKNKASTNYDEIDFSNSSKSPQDKEWNFKIASWNVDGIRAWMSKGGLDYIKHEKPNILCLQETKCSQDKLPDEIAKVPGYHAYWLGSDKDGYAGVGIYTTTLAMNVQYGLKDEELDNEGRIITAEYEPFYLICTYVPNAGRKLVTLPKRLKWNEEFRKYVKELDKKKPVIICGDMNVAHNEIDLSNPKTNRKNAGFTDEERSGMSELLGDGFVDTFRKLYPDKKDAYTFWTYMMNARSRNVGWRLDYFIVSERLLPSVCDNVIRDAVYGSDHCPISLFLHLTTAEKPKEP